nr:hypothetical protein [Tanacetum cinerariifolium]
SSVEDLVLIPSESEGENGCDVPSYFTTFSNILFDADYNFESVDDQSLHNEDVSEKIFSNPLFEEEISSIKKNQHHLNAESDLRLLYDNSSPRPSEEFNSENSNAEIESFSPSPIPNEDSDSFMEEIDLFLTSDDPMPPSIEDDEDSEGDILFLERLLHDDPIPLSNILDFSYEVRICLPFFTYPVTSPVLLSSGSEDKIFDPGITLSSIPGNIKTLVKRILSFKSLFHQLQLRIIIPENLKTLAKGFYPPSLNFLSFNWES